ncbi:MAG: histidine kinase [Bacteroidota bacterium]|nr:histidine kinase [Bacteroidota bacterium]
MRVQFLYKKNILILLLSFFNFILKAQNPSYLKIDTDNGLPSNEVYSILQDKKGFIWIGCDAGIYKYDAINFVKYSNPNQKSKSLSGLCNSVSGRIYAYSFSSEVFYIENDSLYKLESWNKKVSNITCDLKGNLWICSENGISCYNEISKKWTHYNDFDFDGKPDKERYTVGCKLNSKNEITFLTSKGLATLNNKKLQIIPFDFQTKEVNSEYMFQEYQKETWLFKNRGNIIFKSAMNGSFLKQNIVSLDKYLSNSRINNVRNLNDGILWICTYTGIIAFNPDNGTGILLYPNMAFSDIFIDNEKNYWLTTLNDGVIKITDMQYKVWNNSHSNIKSNQITKITCNDSLIFFSNINGQIGILNTKSDSVTVFQSGIKSNVHSLYYDKTDNKLYFSLVNTVYCIEKNELKIYRKNIPPVKSFLQVENQLVIATSARCIMISKSNPNAIEDTITKEWSRQLVYNDSEKLLYIATNSGLLNYKLQNNKFIFIGVYLKGEQILSIDFDPLTKTIYAINFKGEIYQIVTFDKINKIISLPENVQAYELKYNSNNLWIATNKGLWKLNLLAKTWDVLNKSNGLASNNVYSFIINKNSAWLATSAGMQSTPINYKSQKQLSTIFLKNIYIDNKRVDLNKLYNISYKQSMAITLESNAYSSNGNFKYAYRFISNDTNWVVLPGNIDKIEIRNLPKGNFLLEIKLIDNLNRNSVNFIKLNGFVSSPFWQQWWFYLVIMLLFLLLVFMFYKYRIAFLRKKQLNELKKIKLENDLRLSQQSALKAQMNPHFIFNVLNSIKAYIYENDKKNASLYLSRFSDLIRKILNQSTLNKIHLDEEIEILNLYIELESMMMQDGFKYRLTKNIPENTSIKLPALIIQPFIENAFKHGLRHKKGSKELHLIFNYSEVANTLEVKVIDNGIGREASQILNNKDTKTHYSFATDATAKRIALLNYSRKDLVNIEIKDKYSDLNQPDGTEVILTINLNE